MTDEMMAVLKNDIFGINATLLLVNGKNYDVQIKDGFQQMIREMLVINYLFFNEFLRLEFKVWPLDGLGQTNTTKLGAAVC